MRGASWEGACGCLGRRRGLISVTLLFIRITSFNICKNCYKRRWFSNKYLDKEIPRYARNDNLKRASVILKELATEESRPYIKQKDSRPQRDESSRGTTLIQGKCLALLYINAVSRSV